MSNFQRSRIAQGACVQSPRDLESRGYRRLTSGAFAGSTFLGGNFAAVTGYRPGRRGLRDRVRFHSGEISPRQFVMSRIGRAGFPNRRNSPLKRREHYYYVDSRALREHQRRERYELGRHQRFEPRRYFDGGFNRGYEYDRGWGWG